jgi:hypothetical protein
VYFIIIYKHRLLLITYYRYPGSFMNISNPDFSDFGISPHSFILQGFRKFLSLSCPSTLCTYIKKARTKLFFICFLRSQDTVQSNKRVKPAPKRERLHFTVPDSGLFSMNGVANLDYCQYLCALLKYIPPPQKFSSQNGADKTRMRNRINTPVTTY